MKPKEHRPMKGVWCLLLCAVAALGLMAPLVQGQEAVHPLKPPDRSSPRATLKTFLDSCDAVGAFAAKDYQRSHSRAKFHHLASLAGPVLECLDLSEVPPAARRKAGRAVALALYETLSRIPLPPFDEIPDGSQLNQPAGTNVTRWVLPDTEIALQRVQSGPRQGEFLFSPETVARATEFYKRVQALPYHRPPPLKNLHEITVNGGGWMIPYAWVQALPDWLRVPLGGQAGWKWVALLIVLAVVSFLLHLVYRVSHRVSSDRLFLYALAQSLLPAFVLLATPAVAYLALVQINFVGGVGTSIELVVTAVMFLAGAWLSWRAAPVVAEAIIASPKIAPQSIDAHLIRISTRLLGIAVAAGLLAAGADRLGLPLYGIIAGLGVGGLAIALAAQPTIENLIGGLSLFADKPIRVGDFCMYGTEVGTVEAIGIRSTRIRGLDRTVTTIPNAVLSKMPVVNFALRDRMLLKSVLSLRYETTPEQLRYVLAKLRELLVAHPKVTPEPARARFTGFGESSLNVEVFAYVGTKDWNEFLGIQEDLYLRMMDVIASSGTALAFPSQTLYFTRDAGMDPDKTAEAMAQVQQWRAAQKLPFPDFDIEFRKKHRHTLDYPPEGSSTAEKKPQE